LEMANLNKEMKRQQKDFENETSKLNSEMKRQAERFKEELEHADSVLKKSQSDGETLLKTKMDQAAKELQQQKEDFERKLK
jgi:chaperonin cofactor prefoldin